MDNQVYQSMQSFTRYMDRFYLDAVIGLIPGWGDAVALFCVVPFVYFSMFMEFPAMYKKAPVKDESSSLDITPVYNFKPHYSNA